MADEQDLIRRMSNLLDGLQDAMDRAAVVEKSAEAGKTLRKTTMQMRAKAASAIVIEALDYLDTPAPEAVDVRAAAKVLMGLPYCIMSDAFDAMELREGDGVDTQFEAALRALAAGGE